MGFQTCLPLLCICLLTLWPASLLTTQGDDSLDPLYLVDFLVMALSTNHLSIWIFACGKAVAAELMDKSCLDALFALIFNIKLFSNHLARASIEQFQNAGNASSGKSSKGKGLLIFFNFFF